MLAFYFAKPYIYEPFHRFSLDCIINVVIKVKKVFQNGSQIPRADFSWFRWNPEESGRIPALEFCAATE